MQPDTDYSEKREGVMRLIVTELTNNPYGMTMSTLSGALDKASQSSVDTDLLKEAIDELVADGNLVKGNLTYKLKGFTTIKHEMVMLTEYFGK